MKTSFKAHTKRVLAVVLVTAMLLSSMVVAVSATVSDVMGGSVVSSSTVTSGLTYQKTQYTDSKGYNQTAYTMEFNPSSGLMPLPYQKTAGWGVLTSASMDHAKSKGYTVYAGINGEFFSPHQYENGGTLTGRLISNGRVISDGEDINEYCIAFDNQGKMSLVKSETAYHFYVEGKEMGTAAIARINKRYHQNWQFDPICYFDSSCGSKSDSPSTYPGVEVVVQKVNNGELSIGGVLEGEVVSVQNNTYGTSFGADQYVLYACNASVYNEQLAALKPGQKVQIYAEELNDDARAVMENAVSVSSATYPIVVDGKDNTNNTPNASDIYATRAQRTGIGVKADGTYVFICIDGRGDNANYNKGVNLKEFAKLMIDMGCVTAINLDGGGSTQMNVNGTDVLCYGRGVGSSILIVGRDGEAKSDTAKQHLNDWIYNANTTSYATAEQEALVKAAVAKGEAVYNDTNSLKCDYVREMMKIQLAMGAVTDIMPKSFISLDAQDWNYDQGIMQATNDANGALVFNNTNNQWPSALLAVDMNVPATDNLYFDITVYGQSSVNLYTENGTEIKLNKWIAPGSTDAGSDDIIGNGKTFKGSVSVSEISASGLDISGVRIFAVGGAGDGSKVVVRDLAFRNPYSGGDINGNGAVDSTDARAVLRHIANKSILTGSPLGAADANGDGVVDTQDVRYMLRKRVGLA